MMKNRLSFLIATLFVSMVSVAKVSEKFSITTAEGVTINFAVTNEEEKTCEVYGTSDCPAIDRTLDGDITIPGEANGYKVTSIGDKAFYQCANLVSVTIPEGVVSIGEAAFYGCTNIKTIHIPSSVQRIKGYAFFNCENLMSATLPEGIKEISSCLFEGCFSLSSVSIPSTVTTIEDYAFLECKQLADVVIPEGVTDIGAMAFYGCEGLTSINMPHSLVRIALSAFRNCIQLTEVSFPAYCQLSEIGPSVFSGCTHLKTINLPLRLKSLGNGTFNNCINLQSIVLPEGIPSIESNTFEGCERLESVQIPASVESIGFYAFGSCSTLTSVTFAEGSQLNSIGDNAFTNCVHLSSLQLPESVHSIGYKAFGGCQNLRTIYMPQGVSLIGGEAFGDCHSLESVVLPTHLQAIQWNTFAYCRSLTSVIIPEGVSRIERFSFGGCEKLTEVELPSTLTEIGDNAFGDCPSLNRVISHIQKPFDIARNVFEWYGAQVGTNFFTTATLYIPHGTRPLYEILDTWSLFPEIIEEQEYNGYRPFIEDGKVWTVKCVNKVYPDAYYYIYYFFTKDVVVNGKPCKKMAYKYDFRPAEEAGYGHIPETGGDAGTYYEEDKRVYSIWSGGTPLLMYDFEAGKGDTIHVYSQSDKKVAPFVIDGKTLEESESFKGISTRLRSVLHLDGETDTWMEGVGWMTRPADDGNYDGDYYLMACTVGDEVLYKHPDWTIDESEALGKKRVDFTHVIKTKPKSPQQRTEKVGNGMISGEYSMNVLAIDLGTLHDAYTVTIKASSGNVVYTKEVKTSRVLALNIDIAEYADGDYTITVENNREIFTGLFNLSRPNAIEEIPCAHPVADDTLHDLTGRPVTGHPQRGVYIRNGKKVLIR